MFQLFSGTLKGIRGCDRECQQKEIMNTEEIIVKIRDIISSIVAAQQHFNPTKAWDYIDEAKRLLIELKLKMQCEEDPEIIDSDDIEIKGEVLTNIITGIRAWCQDADKRIKEISRLHTAEVTPLKVMMEDRTRAIRSLQSVIDAHSNRLFILEQKKNG
jgi:hypothetical protein